MDKEKKTEDKVKAPSLSKIIYGGVLDYDGAGHYPGLELLNFVFGTVGDQMLPSGTSVKVQKKAHDFARRLVWDEGFTDTKQKREILYDNETEDAVRYLLSCLQLPIPSTAKSPGWDRAHFFPFTRSLIHWDARKAKKTSSTDINIERRYLRGGGALVFHILRNDHNSERLERNRSGFVELFTDNDDSALEKLAESLLSQGYKDSSEGKEDNIESESSLKNDQDEELLRDGILNILEHKELPAVTRIRALMNWGCVLACTDSTLTLQQISQPRAQSYYLRLWFITCPA